MRETSPSGHTSFSRTAMCATGLSTENSSSTAGWPTMSMSVTRAGVSKVIDCASSRALVAREFGAEPDDAVFPAISARRLLR